MEKIKELAKEALFWMGALLIGLLCVAFLNYVPEERTKCEKFCNDCGMTQKYFFESDSMVNCICEKDE